MQRQGGLRRRCDLLMCTPDGRLNCVQIVQQVRLPLARLVDDFVAAVGVCGDEIERIMLFAAVPDEFGNPCRARSCRTANF